jgi:hypothetical protein
MLLLNQIFSHRYWMNMEKNSLIEGGMLSILAHVRSLFTYIINCNFIKIWLDSSRKFVIAWVVFENLKFVQITTIKYYSHYILFIIWRVPC